MTRQDIMERLAVRPALQHRLHETVRHRTEALGVPPDASLLIISHDECIVCVYQHQAVCFIDFNDDTFFAFTPGTVFN